MNLQKEKETKKGEVVVIILDHKGGVGVCVPSLGTFKVQNGELPDFLGAVRESLN